MFKRQPLQDAIAGVPRDVINPLGHDDNAPVAELALDFAMQSMLVAAVSQYAILPQAPNQPIVQSTLKESQHSGYAIALSSDSEMPVAIKFKGGSGGQKTSSAVIILTPGEIVRPVGMNGSFSGFDYGLPQGWLGGGKGRLVIFKSPDSYLRYVGVGSDASLFHQMAYTIVAADNITQPPNWPRTFPWLNASSQLNAAGVATAAAVAQGSKGRIVARTTKTLFELVCNVAGLAAATTVNTYIHKDGAAIPVIGEDLVFPPAPVGSNSSVLLEDSVLNTLGGDADYVNFVNAGAAAGLVLNIYRYGIVG